MGIFKFNELNEMTMTQNEIEILRIGFNAGITVGANHPEDDEFDSTYFEQALKEVELLNGIKTGERKNSELINPYLLSDDELDNAVNQRKKGY
jgi:hypothetical protein